MDVNTESTAKSIVNAEYRNKYKGDKDWLAKLLDAEATKTKTVKVTKVVGDEKVISEETRADGVDIPALFVLAEKNGLNVDTYRGQEGNHGFAGRFRMTVRNMLQRVVKQRHGLFNKGGTFVLAPADFLEAIGAGEAPSHNQDGSKIAKPAAEPAESAPEAEAPKKAKGKKAAAAADPADA